MEAVADWVALVSLLRLESDLALRPGSKCRFWLFQRASND